MTDADLAHGQPSFGSSIGNISPRIGAVLPSPSGRYRVSSIGTRQLMLAAVALLGCKAGPTVHPQQRTHEESDTDPASTPEPRYLRVDVDESPTLYLFFDTGGTSESSAARVDVPALGILGRVVQQIPRSTDDVTIEVGWPWEHAIELRLDGQGCVVPGSDLACSSEALSAEAYAARPRPIRSQATGSASGHEESVRIDSGQGVTLAGTVTSPDRPGPHPAVVLVSDLGPDERNMTLLSHSMFAVLASLLTQAGFVVLRYDDRGAGGSGGTYPSSPIPTLATDVEQGMLLLRARGDVRRDRVGVVAFGSGVLVAAAGAPRARADFLVLLSPPLRPLVDEWASQASRVADALGHGDVPAPTAAMGEDLESLARRAIVSFAGRTESEHDLEVFHQLGFSAPMIETLSSPWARAVMNEDPLAAVLGASCPTLALWGAVDLEVDPDDARRRLDALGRTEYQSRLLSGLNHRLQTAPDGLPSRYGVIEQTIDPIVSEEIASWVDGLGRANGNASASHKNTR